jgi:hypothetical protein
MIDEVDVMNGKPFSLSMEHKGIVPRYNTYCTTHRGWSG